MQPSGPTTTAGPPSGGSLLTAGTRPARPSGDQAGRLRPPGTLVLRVTGAYVLSRGAIAATLAVLEAVSPYPGGLAGRFRPWDSGFYLGIAQHGYLDLSYPATHAIGLPAQRSLAFFPGYPLLIRSVHEVTGLGYYAAGLAVSLIAGLAATLLVAAVVAHYGSVRDATWTAVLFAVSPCAVALSYVYSDALLVALAGATVLLLTRRRWWAAGIAAGLAGLVRPSGVYLCVPVVFTAMLAIRRAREWRSLVAVALAPCGFLAYMGWLWYRTGHPDIWFAFEHQGWASRLDFGQRLWHYVSVGAWSTGFLRDAMIGVAFLLLCCVIWVAGGVRLPALLLVAVLAFVLPNLLWSDLGFRPRYLLPAFPLLLVVAWGLRRAWQRWAVAGLFLVASCLLAVFWSANFAAP